MAHYPWAATEQAMKGQEVILKATGGQRAMSYRTVKTALGAAMSAGLQLTRYQSPATIQPLAGPCVAHVCRD